MKTKNIFGQADATIGVDMTYRKMSLAPLLALIDLYIILSGPYVPSSEV